MVSQGNCENFTIGRQVGNIEGVGLWIAIKEMKKGHSISEGFKWRSFHMQTNTDLFKLVPDHHPMDALLQLAQGRTSAAPSHASVINQLWLQINGQKQDLYHSLSHRQEDILHLSSSLAETYKPLSPFCASAEAPGFVHVFHFASHNVEVHKSSSL